MVSEEMYELGSKRSAIRELFEYGKKRAEVVGAENVYDFSLGNPTVPAPDCVNETIRELTEELNSIQLHGYTSAQGDLECRQATADYLNRTYGTHFHADNFYMTMGAAASLSICFKALTTDRDDEFITIAPFFPEYRVFVESAGAKLVVIPPDTSNFQIDFDALEKSLTPHTKGVIINSPNNPSGAVYSAETIAHLAEILRKKSVEFGTEIFILSDEPYREIAYDGVEVPYVTEFYDNTLVCYSYSKSLSLPGERIGYVLVPDEAYESKKIYAAICGAGRALGYVCAPSLFQKVVTRCIGATGDISLYKKNRDILYKGLTDIGYECYKPDGAFYMFVKALEPDADAFCEKAKEEDLLIVSATGFGCPGYVRISYCVDEDMIRRSFAAFERLYKKYK
ncbi:pyridoxal phosphate-dependent aminotransferase [Roseburia sp. MUC/MUC-530-WT-4D]|uniref:Aminotransferase n=1 Tax=Roseburia porci TaxID=2605790 RepID=A0A6L5YU08_9FIRM|nr:pyridoxal phosphate-dependent aminotransferase [Roseburia porci]MCI5516897.1 pyridoxal phosphate-dependent aminotransferase [Roseburia sp.]MDD6743194.1 pyridoxal phosphate-dependent aminotransferase [Roseburia porci]MST75432.1 pyridoxal phosphate-dependent aminotransferase [Roseburia porci]